MSRYSDLREISLAQHLATFREDLHLTKGPICIRGVEGELVDLTPAGIRAVHILAARGLMEVHQTIIGTFAQVKA